MSNPRYKEGKVDLTNFTFLVFLVSFPFNFLPCSELLSYHENIEMNWVVGVIGRFK